MTAESGAAGGAAGAGAAGAAADAPPVNPETILADLEAGLVRSASPDPTVPGGWRVNADVKAAILGRFADKTMLEWSVGPFTFRDRAGVPPRDLAGGPWRVVPGGTTVRSGTYLAPGVVIMPPSYINVGAWVGANTMVDSAVLVGSCAQIGDNVHLSAGVVIGGVLEPANAMPVIVEDGAFVGAGCSLLDGVRVSRGAVIAAGVTLTGTSRLYDTVRGTVLQGTADAPLVVPANAVVVPGTRRIAGAFADEHGLATNTAIIVKDRDEGTSARVALESALR